VLEADAALDVVERTLAISMRWLKHDDTVISQARKLRHDMAHLSRS
jgi:hypothetical protein